MSGALAAAAGEVHGAFSLTAILVGIVLLALNGFFVAAEIALLAARRTRIEEAADAGDPRARMALAALRELSVTFSGAQLGITMCSLGLGAVAEPAIATLLVDILEVTPLSPGARAAIAFAVALSIVVFLHMVVGEMAPKNLALSRAEDVSLRLARTFGWFVRIFRPVILLLNGMANGLVRLVRVEPVDEHRLVHTPDELMLVLTESRRHGTIGAQDVRVMTAALHLSEIDAEAAMTPRVDLVALPDTAPAGEVLRCAADSGRTRIPVFHDDIDHVVGVVNVKDVLVRDQDTLEGVTAADVLRPIPAVPESRDLEELLYDMLDSRSHAVLVVDEFGGTAGMLTLEDVLEEVVGEIEDEFDEAAPDGTREPEDGLRRWTVAGTLRPDELERQTGLRLPEGDYETLSGYLTDRLGRLVETGDEVVTDNSWVLRVTSLEGRRAGDVEVRAPVSLATSDRGRSAHE